MKRFDGTLEELQALVATTGQDGTWHQPGANHHQFRAAGGAVLNWWNTKKKTVSFQGPDPAKGALEAALDSASGGAPADVAATPVAPAATVAQPERIFVVHGHDQTAREQLELILHRLNLDPFVLQNTAGMGMTIIEALERQIGRTPEAEFGIVLMTPDDMGYAKREGETAIKPRSRQNVVMEMGMLLASLTRKRVAILVKGHLEQPSDAQGIIYFHFNEHVKEVVPKLVERLRQAGFEITPEQISKAQA